MIRALLLAACLAGPAASLQQRSLHRVDGALDTILQGVDGAESVEIATRDGLALAATYLPPKRGGQLAPGAILVHDAGAGREQLLDVGERLWKSGFAVLALDLRGHGRSATDDLSWTRLDEEGRRSLWAFATRDLEAGASWLRRKPEVHSTNLSVVGLGAGSALAVRQASRDENVRALVLLGPNPREYGFDVVGELQDLGGLPTYVVTRRDEKPTAEAMVARVHQGAGGHPFVELLLCSAKPSEEIAGDVRLQGSIARWLRDKAMPQRGRR